MEHSQRARAQKQPQRAPSQRRRAHPASARARARCARTRTRCALSVSLPTETTRCEPFFDRQFAQNLYHRKTSRCVEKVCFRYEKPFFGVVKVLRELPIEKNAHTASFRRTDRRRRGRGAIPELDLGIEGGGQVLAIWPYPHTRTWAGTRVRVRALASSLALLSYVDSELLRLLLAPALGLRAPAQTVVAGSTSLCGRGSRELAIASSLAPPRSWDE